MKMLSVVGLFCIHFYLCWRIQVLKVGSTLTYAYIVDFSASWIWIWIWTCWNLMELNVQAWSDACRFLGCMPTYLLKDIIIVGIFVFNVKHFISRNILITSIQSISISLGSDGGPWSYPKSKSVRNCNLKNVFDYKMALNVKAVFVVHCTYFILLPKWLPCDRVKVNSPYLLRLLRYFPILKRFCNISICSGSKPTKFPICRSQI